jgi:hypothetical protein
MHEHLIMTFLLSRYHRYLVDYAVCSAKKSANPDDSVAECSLKEEDSAASVSWFLILLAALALITLSLQWKEFWGKVKGIKLGRKSSGNAYRYFYHQGIHTYS